MVVREYVEGLWNFFLDLNNFKNGLEVSDILWCVFFMDMKMVFWFINIDFDVFFNVCEVVLYFLCKFELNVELIG